MEIDAKYYLSCLTSLYRREKKIHRTHCDEPVDEQIMKSTLIFSVHNTTYTKFEVSTLTNLAPGLIINTSFFQILLLLSFMLQTTFLQEHRNSLTFTLTL